MAKSNNHCNFKVTGSKLIYNKEKKNRLEIIASIFKLIVMIVILGGISYGFINLFKLTADTLEQKISYCSAIATFACAVITVSTLLADRQLKIYDDSLNIFNELNFKRIKELSEKNAELNIDKEKPLHRWYFIKKYKTYSLMNKKKIHLHISNALITFYFSETAENKSPNNSLELKIPLTTAEWNFFIVLENYMRMLHYQKYYLFELFSSNDEDGLLMWETVLSLYKSVMINKTMNFIRLISIIIIPIVIIIACIV